MSKAKSSKYVRVRLDFTIILDKEIDSNIIVGPREADRLQLALLAVLAGNKSVESIAPGASTSSSLDLRPRDKAGKLASGTRGGPRCP